MLTVSCFSRSPMSTFSRSLWATSSSAFSGQAYTTDRTVLRFWYGCVWQLFTKCILPSQLWHHRGNYGRHELLQRGSIACYAERCINYDRFCLTVCLTRRFLSAAIRITLNDLECPIHLKVHLVDGTLDVRLCGVRIRPYTHRCSQRDGGGIGWKAYPLHVGSWRAVSLRVGLRLQG